MTNSFPLSVGIVEEPTGGIIDRFGQCVGYVLCGIHNRYFYTKIWVPEELKSKPKAIEFISSMEFVRDMLSTYVLCRAVSSAKTPYRCDANSPCECMIVEHDKRCNHESVGYIKEGTDLPKDMT